MKGPVWISSAPYRESDSACHCRSGRPKPKRFILIDLLEVVALFFTASKQWTKPEVAIIDPLEEAENEPAYKEAIAAGHKLGWLWAGRIRQHKRNGWKPVTERTKLGLPSIFMDRNKELILMYKPGEPQKSS